MPYNIFKEGVFLNMKHIEKKEVLGTIARTFLAIPDEAMEIRNSKTAEFSYLIDGHYYVSENSITIPMRYNIGDTLIIKYNIEKPTEIFPKHKIVI